MFSLSTSDRHPTTAHGAAPGAITAGIAILGLCGAAAAQISTTNPPLRWYDNQNLSNHSSADDAGEDIAAWVETAANPDKNWVFVTGYVTEVDAFGVVQGTRIATYKYDADAATNPGPDASIYFPPIGTAVSGTHKGMAIAVHAGTGDVYVAGQVKRAGFSDQDYIVIRYDANLQFIDSETFNGNASGNDIAADILLVLPDADDAEAVLVTGTSAGSGTVNDIVTLALDYDDLGRKAYWPTTGEGPGVRRYDYEDDDDQGIEVGYIPVAEPAENAPPFNAIVFGYSWGDVEEYNYTTHSWGGLNATLQWDSRFDSGADGWDIGRGMSILEFESAFFIFVTGYAETPGLGGTVDFTTVSYRAGDGGQRWVYAWDYDGLLDAPTDIAAIEFDSDIYIFVTGHGETGSDFDATSLALRDQGEMTPAFDWSHGLFHDEGYSSCNYALFVHDGSLYASGIFGPTDGSDWTFTTLKYERQDQTPGLEWVKQFELDSGSGYDAGNAVVVMLADDNLGQHNLTPCAFPTGTGHHATHGQDFVTIRYR